MQNNRIVERKPTYWVGHWPSVEAWAEDGKAGADKNVPGAEGSSRKHKPSEEWDLNQGFDTVYDRALMGWPEAAGRIRDTAMPIVDKITSQMVVETYNFVDDGSVANDFDVPTLLTGEPSHWLQSEDEFINGKGNRIIKIASCITSSCGVGADKMVLRGVVAAALAYCLEAAGFMVEVCAVSVEDGGWGGKGRLVSWVNIKKPGDIMDLNRVAMALANPGMLRRLHFGIVEGDERMVKPSFNHGGYGMPGNVNKTELAEEKVDIYIDRDVTDYTPAEAIEYVIRKLKEQGVNIRNQ